MILEDRVAVITAAGSGIGRAGAQAMARDGAFVVATDLIAERAEETAAGIVSAGGRAEARGVDVGDDAALVDLMDWVAARHGHIDILHSHAGIQIEGDIEELDTDGLDRSYQLNVHAHFVAVKSVMPHMKRRGGVILLTSSNAGVFPDYGMTGYITTKAAVVMMTEQIALDLGKYGIRVNALCPGWIDTPFNDAYERQLGGREALEKVVATRVPLRRFGRIDEIAEAILFLVSDRSSYITGHALVVDGGERLVGAGPKA
jgi:NAD(P)-dependent dehydrogenase (short-subunit alcohol dehydrogenase family)